uniref:Putative secreted peptide n=1 Tax=Anopheles braziliensis TaxID=58242 RepID=A0A2M3ZUM8_9DIPT
MGTRRLSHMHEMMMMMVMGIRLVMLLVVFVFPSSPRAIRAHLIRFPFAACLLVRSVPIFGTKMHTDALVSPGAGEQANRKHTRRDRESEFVRNSVQKFANLCKYIRTKRAASLRQCIPPPN